MNLLLGLFVVLFANFYCDFAEANGPSSDGMEQLLARLDMVETKQRESAAREGRFINTVDQLTKEVGLARARELELNNIITHLTKQLEAQASQIQELNSRCNGQHLSSDPEAMRHLGRRQLDYGVAFTAFLDHVITNIGYDQTIVYNRVIINARNGYSNNTGIFRAPVPGLYLFSWSVTARSEIGSHRSYDVWVPLLVNGQKKVTAVAESRTEADDNQGSNTAVVRLSMGDEVWTVHDSGNKEVHGDNSGTTSFTGVLIYETEV